MTAIAFFNNKGGVGKTTLVYHLAAMFAELGKRVLVADYDPQANLTAMCLDTDSLEKIEENGIATIYDVAAPLIRNGRDVPPTVFEVGANLGLIVGDLRLSSVEDSLSQEWTQCLGGSELTRDRAFQVTTLLARAAERAKADFQADLVFIDIGPNLGAINRSALLGADYVIVPVAPDLFSLQGMSNVGRGLREWREGWRKRLEDNPDPDVSWPVGRLEPLGYVISRFSVYAKKQSYHFRRWIDRVPAVFHRDILDEPAAEGMTVESDRAQLAWLKDYRSLMPMAHEAHKPIFKLRPADGAIGGHQGLVTEAYNDFEGLARRVAERIGLTLGPV